MDARALCKWVGGSPVSVDASRVVGAAITMAFAVTVRFEFIFSRRHLTI